MQLIQQFNAQQFDPTQGGNFSQLPKGLHPVIAVASEVKATTAGDGGMLVFELEVIDGPNKGARGPFRINLYSSSDKAREIAERTFSAMCHATGVFLVNDSSQLHNIPFAVEVEEQTLTPQQVEQQQQGKTVTPFTQVRKVLNINCEEPKAQAQQQQQQPAQGAQNGGWGGGATQQQQPAQQAAAPAPAAGKAWGGGGQVQTPAPAAAPAPAAGGWQQGGGQAAAPAANAGGPAWGRN